MDRAIRGLRANASTLSHAELDEAEELDDGDPADLAARHVALRGSLPNLTILGGCCGTDIRHVTASATPGSARSGEVLAEGDRSGLIAARSGRQSSASGYVENFAITTRAGWWMRIH